MRSNPHGRLAWKCDYAERTGQRWRNQILFVILGSMTLAGLLITWASCG